jgi:hypothetical protein
MNAAGKAARAIDVGRVNSGISLVVPDLTRSDSRVRCITKPSGICLNCQISAVACTFDSPAAADVPRPRNKKAESKPKAGNGMAEASSSRPMSRSYGSSGYTSPSIPLASPSVKLERRNSLRSDVISPLTSGLELGGAFSNIVLNWDPPTLGSGMSEISTPNSVSDAPNFSHVTLNLWVFSLSPVRRRSPSARFRR